MIDLFLGMMFKMKEKVDIVVGGQKSFFRLEFSLYGGFFVYVFFFSYKFVFYLDRSLILDIVQFFLFCLYVWGLDLDFDKFCMNKLGLLQFRCLMFFGLILRIGYMFLMLFGWYKLFCQEEFTGKMLKEVMRTFVKVILMQQVRLVFSGQFDKFVILVQRYGLIQSDYIDSDQDSDFGNKRVILERRFIVVQDEMKAFLLKVRWQIFSVVIINYLLFIILIVNILMSMSYVIFVIDKIKKKRNR